MYKSSVTGSGEEMELHDDSGAIFIVTGSLGVKKFKNRGNKGVQGNQGIVALRARGVTGTKYGLKETFCHN